MRKLLNGLIKTPRRTKKMRFKLILAFVEDARTDKVLDAAREAGATGATVINNARGQGLNQKRTFLD